MCVPVLHIRTYVFNALQCHPPQIRLVLIKFNFFMVKRAFLTYMPVTIFLQSSQRPEVDIRSSGAGVKHQMLAAMLVLGTQTGSSGRVTSDLNH